MKVSHVLAVFELFIKLLNRIAIKQRVAAANKIDRAQALLKAADAHNIEAARASVVSERISTLIN